ncbi:MAG: 1-deoxy-D-xylulose-5-phosphate reductoisomerase [Acidobacteria bacterium]|nr:1-deoxy-D-xylulose-5-phosphate reductoisomerase [Acidobacteriota bacterium]
MKSIAILGSTGSIGRSALAVVDAHPDRLSVAGLAAGTSAARLAEQASRYRPAVVSMASPEALADLERHGLPEATVAGSGPVGLTAVATHPAADIVLCASSGTAALEAALAAIDAGKTIALANKEVLVMAGGLMMDAARRRGVSILPVDSEHNAIHQCLDRRPPAEVARLLLTASGGPFRDWPAERLQGVTPEQALRHPTWSMGPKITVDSATLMNKGLEVIEARWLFDVPPDRIDVVIHPQSIVHSLVELRDGSVLAQLGVTDMRLPIQYAFSYPERWGAPLPGLDLARCGALTFGEPDHGRFPCLGLAYGALSGGPGLPVVLNAANEVAVAAFLEGRLPFPGIAAVIEEVLDAGAAGPAAAPDSLAGVRELDRWARERGAAEVAGIQSSGSIRRGIL